MQSDHRCRYKAGLLRQDRLDHEVIRSRKAGSARCRCESRCREICRFDQRGGCADECTAEEYLPRLLSRHSRSPLAISRAYVSPSISNPPGPGIGLRAIGEFPVEFRKQRHAAGQTPLRPAGHQCEIVCRRGAITVRPCSRMEAPNKPQICLQYGTRCACNMEHGGIPGSVCRCVTLHSSSPRVFSVVRRLILPLPCILKVLLS